MNKIKIQNWQPADGMILESNALLIATSTHNNLVVAGPGAGKTELLAQKASFLLQTNTCRFPYKILAISFKRDAAYNLKERVRLRCGDELSRRFDSLTFDSFAKQILDRFKQALPDDYKINGEYDIFHGDKFILDYYESEDINYFNTVDKNKILELHYAQLPHSLTSNADQIRKNVWNKMLNVSQAKLSFKMIMRLAEYIINSNPKIKDYLQKTYHYVFLDEFQDTTEAQYDLFKSCFLGSKSLFTAVGDDKQRIMLWAGAQHSIFDDFIMDTNAVRTPLAMNFRCAPRLVTLLNYLSENLLGKTDFAIPSSKWKPDQGDCSIWVFNNPIDEMHELFSEVFKWVTVDGINPREICILVKQQLSQYAGNLIDYFNQNSLKTRDENKFQDILTDDLSIFIVDMLYIIFDKNNHTARGKSFSFLSNIHTELDEQQLLVLESRLSRFIKDMRVEYVISDLADDAIKLMVSKVVGFADINRLRSYYPNYKNIVFLESVINNLQDELIENYKITSSLLPALDMLVGKDTIPVMTIHKSKGLEYQSVIFIGLEDGAFWSFQKQPDEDKCSFFVALSRAKERVIFTFSHQREGKYGMTQQSIKNISVIIEQLQNSRVVSIVKKT